MKKIDFYLNHIFDDIDYNITLDNEQKEVVLDNNKYLMVIAGAGSGKTTTLAAKVKYLVDIKKISPKDILIISYTNKAVNELSNLINKKFNINAQICTFHHYAYSLIKEEHNFKITTNGKQIIKDYILSTVLHYNSTKNVFLDVYKMYLSTVLHTFPQNLLFDYTFSTGKIDKNTRKNITELETLWIIYNINIEYNYYNFSTNTYYFCILIIDDTVIYVDYINRNDLKSIFEINIKKYNAYKNKLNYLCIYTNESILEKVKEFCKNKNINLKRNKRTDRIRNIFLSSKFIDMFISDIYTFILLCKRYNIKKISSNNDKLNIFLNDLYSYYKTKLREKNSIDFEDIILLATKNLKKNKKYPKYIIVDEYQDISYERFLFLKKIIEISKSYLIVVGDDWQTIYSFAGSNINLFLNFKDILNISNVKVIKINKTYRNSQELINIAGNFIMKNDLQIKKNLLSNKKLNNPIKFCYYCNNKDKIKKLKFILNNIYKKDKNLKVLILLRYKFDINFLIRDKEFIFKENNLIYKKYPDMYITYMTVHAAKGLGYDEVIIVNNEDGLYGFPSNKEDSIFIKLLDNRTKKDILDEERRLFYVALTRTKNNVYLLINKYNPSIFIKELNN